MVPHALGRGSIQSLARPVTWSLSVTFVNLLVSKLTDKVETVSLGLPSGFRLGYCLTILIGLPIKFA